LAVVGSSGTELRVWLMVEGESLKAANNIMDERNALVKMQVWEWKK
jgi:hypothetical protein